MSNLKMNYHLTKKFHETKHNPYPEDSRAWHTWIDICVIHGDGAELDVDQMMAYHGLGWDYYEEILEVLAEDGYLDRVYFFNKEVSND